MLTLPKKRLNALLNHSSDTDENTNQNIKLKKTEHFQATQAKILPKAGARPINRQTPSILELSTDESSASQSKRSLSTLECTEVLNLKITESSATPKAQSRENFCFDEEGLQFMIQQDRQMTCYPHYIEDNQKEVSKQMRCILLDWIMEICSDLQFKRECFHMSCNMVDRYMHFIADIKKAELQLVGVSALSLAAKFEEVSMPKMEEFAKFTSNIYTTAQIAHTELSICKVYKNM
jgi:hypothetical protein